MSKVFITKNGQFLSRGEGVLTQIENPDLEVNDLYDTEEIQAAIRDDVKEGDIVYRVDSALMPENYEGDFYATTKTRLFVFKGKLHCIAYSDLGYIVAPGLVLWRYDEGGWVRLSFLLKGVSRNLFTGGGAYRIAVHVEEDTFYVGAGTSGRDNQRFAVWKWSGSEFIPISVPQIDPNDNSLGFDSTLGTSNSTGMACEFFKESSGRVLFANGFNSEYQTDKALNSIKVYEFDVSSESFNLLSMDPSSAQGGNCNDTAFVEYDGSTHLGRFGADPGAGGDTWEIFRWNTSSSNWDLWTTQPQYFGHSRGGDLFSDSSGNLWVANTNNGASVRDLALYLKRPEDSDFNNNTRQQTGDASAVTGSRDIKIFEHNNNIYVVSTHVGQVSNIGDTYRLVLWKWDWDASGTGAFSNSLIELHNVETIPRSQNGAPYYTGSVGCEGMDLLKFNDEFHVAVGYTGHCSRSISFYKFNPVTETLDINFTPSFYNGRPGSGFANSFFEKEFQGSSFTVSINSPHQIYKYHTSGVFSGTYQGESYRPDLLTGSYYAGAPLSDTSSFRYVTGGSSNPKMSMWEFELSSGGIYKLEGDVNQDTSYNMYNISVSQLSGIDYIFGNYWSPEANPFRFWQVSGVSAIPLEAPSSNPAYPTGFANMYCYIDCAKSISYDNKIFAVAGLWQNYLNGSNSSGIQCWSWSGPGSTWDYIPIEVSAGLPLRERRTRGLDLHVHDNELYMLVNQEEFPYLYLHKYDTSSNVFRRIPVPHQIRDYTQFGVYKMLTIDNKLAIIRSSGNLNYTANTLHIRNSEYDWDTIVLGHGGGTSTSQLLPTHYLQKDEDLWILQYRGLAPVASVGKYDPRFKDGCYAKHRGCQLEQIVDESFSNVGIAMEDGSKGDIIKIRRKK